MIWSLLVIPLTLHHSKTLEDLVTTRLDYTNTIVRKVTEGHYDRHTQLLTIHANIATKNTANMLLSDLTQ